MAQNIFKNLPQPQPIDMRRVMFMAVLLCAMLGAMIYWQYLAGPRKAPPGRDGQKGAPEAPGGAEKVVQKTVPFVLNNAVYETVKDESLPEMQDFLADTKAVLYTFQRLQATTDAQLKEEADGTLNWDRVMKNAPLHRGKAMYIRGRLLIESPFRWPDNPSGVTQTYQGLIQDYADNRYAFIALGVPGSETLRAGDEVELYGVFVRKWAYQTTPTVQGVAPVVIGRTLVRKSVEAESSNPWEASMKGQKPPSDIPFDAPEGTTGSAQIWPTDLPPEDEVFRENQNIFDSVVDEKWTRQMMMMTSAEGHRGVTELEHLQEVNNIIHEAAIVHYLFRFVKQIPLEELRKRVDPKATYAALMNFPENFRQAVVRVDGKLRSVETVEWPYKNFANVKVYYRLFIQGGQHSNEIFVVNALNYDPKKTPVEQRVSCHGVFMKRWVYPNQLESWTYTPLIFANKVEYVPPPKFDNFGGTTGLLLGSAGVLVIVILFIGYKLERRVAERATAKIRESQRRGYEQRVRSGRPPIVVAPKRRKGLVSLSEGQMKIEPPMSGDYII